MSEVTDAIHRARRAQIAHDTRIPVQLEITEEDGDVLNTLYMLKYDGDETPSHPWTVVRLERRRSSYAGAEVTFKIVDAAQMTSQQEAVDQVIRLQRGEVTLEELTVDET